MAFWLGHVLQNPKGTTLKDPARPFVRSCRYPKGGGVLSLIVTVPQGLESKGTSKAVRILSQASKTKGMESEGIVYGTRCTGQYLCLLVG